MAAKKKREREREREGERERERLRESEIEREISPLDGRQWVGGTCRVFHAAP
jgi:hypothetical protein